MRKVVVVLISILTLTGVALAQPAPTRVKALQLTDGVTIPVGVSAAGTARVRYNNSLSRLEQSINGAAYAAFGGGGGAGNFAALWALNASAADATALLNATSGPAIWKNNATPLDPVMKWQTSGAVDFMTTGPTSLVLTYPALGASLTGIATHKLQNPTAAALGAQQWSPATSWCGSGWNITASAARIACMTGYVRPTQQASGEPTVDYAWAASVNGGAPTDVLTLNSVGSLAMPGTFLLTSNQANATGAAFTFNATAAYNATTNPLARFTTGGQDAFKIISDNLPDIYLDGFNITSSAFLSGWLLQSNKIRLHSTVTLSPQSDFGSDLGGSADRWSTAWFRARGGVEQTVASAASITVTPTSGEAVRITLGATAVTTVNLGGTPNPGECFVTFVIQDATGSRLISGWSTSWVFAGGSASYTVTPTLNRRDAITWCWDATATKVYETSRAMNLF